MASHGKLTVLKLDNWATGSAVLTDISAKCSNVDFPETIDSNDTTGFGVNSKTSVSGLKSGSFSIAGIWDATIHAHLNSLKGRDAINVEYGPAGSANGSPKDTALCHMTSFKKTNPVGDIVKFTADFQVSGDVGNGVY